MAIAVDPRKTREFVTAADRKLPEEKQTVWLIRDLPQRIRQEIDDSVSFAQEGQESFSTRGWGTRKYLALRHGLMGTRKDRPLRDADGNPVEYTRERGTRKGEFVTSDEFIERMSAEDQAKVAQAIMREDAEEEEEEDEREKFAPSPDSSGAS